MLNEEELTPTHDGHFETGSLEVEDPKARTPTRPYKYLYFPTGIWPLSKKGKVVAAAVFGCFFLLVLGIFIARNSNSNQDNSAVAVPVYRFMDEEICQPENVFCTALVLIGKLQAMTNVSRSSPGIECECIHKSSLLVPIGGTAMGQPSPSYSTQRVKSTTAQEYLRPPIRLDPALIQTRPIPTNAWWGNLIHRDDEAGNPSNPVFSQPYRLQFRTDADFKIDSDIHMGIHVSHPYHYRLWGHDNENKATAYYYHWYTIDLVLSAKELTDAAPSNVHTLVTDWDDSGFGVTAGIYDKTNPDSYIKTHLTQGMAFVTADYHAWTPSVLLTDRRISSLKVGTSPNPTKARGTVTTDKLILELDDDQQWVVYTSQPIQWIVSETSLVAADQVLDGTLTLRVAKLPNPKATTIYDPHRNCIVTGGQLFAPDSSHYAIQWHTRGEDCANNGFLHFALPHQAAIIADEALAVEGLILQSTTRGDMQAYVSPTGLWRFQEVPDHDVGFLPPNPLSPELLDQTNLASILEQEISEYWDIRNDGSYYWNGKSMQKYATLCLLANEKSVVGDSGPYSNLLDICLEKLKSELEDFVNNTWKYPLVYDEIYRGIVSSEGLVNNNTMSDFGNSVYNDHHYHWGYWIVSSAILRHLSPDWDRMDELSEIVELLIRDVANPSSDDPWFPMFRSFDWYLGHSLSRGVTPNSDGKDQESVSEEMNLHYGMLLWGRVSNNPSLEQLAQLMLKVNARSIQSYYLFTNDNKVRSERILPNKVAGILYDNKITYTTWFCSFRECIHGIQMIPVSPVNPIYRSDKFVAEEWADVLSKLPVFEDNPTSSWLSLMYANLAHVDRATALEKLPDTNLDSGLSRSWAMYYAAVQDES